MGEREGEGARERERRESEAVDKFGKHVQATLAVLVGGEHAGLVGDEHKSQRASTTKAETTTNAEPLCIGNYFTCFTDRLLFYCWLVEHLEMLLAILRKVMPSVVSLGSI